MLSFRRVKSLARHRETSLALRVLSALVVWLSVGGHLGGLAHFALVSHHVCATHSALAHGEEHAQDAVGPEPAPDGSSSLTAASGTEDEHEDCSVVARKREQLASRPGSPPLLAPAPVAETSAPPLEDPSLRAAAVLTLAPKTSPPVA